MAESIHLIIGTPDNLPVFSKKEDIHTMKRYLELYAHRMQISVAGYRFKSGVLHLLVGEHERLKQFLDGVLDAFVYYYSTQHNKELRFVYKMRQRLSAKERTQLLRYIHQGEDNSLEEYERYSRYVKRELVSVPLGWSLLSGNFRDRDTFLQHMVREPEPAYAQLFTSIEVFEPDKLSKRRARAKAFLGQFLESRALSLEELMREEHRSSRFELIRAFREETDLSFRDIGYVLGMSHTSVIRILREG